MMSLYRNGSAEDRCRNSQRISHIMQTDRKQMVAVHTRNSIRDFEEHLKSFQEPEGDRVVEDNLPLGATATLRQPLSTITLDDNRSDSSGSPRSPHAQRFKTFRKSASDSVIAPGAQLEVGEHLHERRPPSPLGFYDYGRISQKPRSTLSQHQRCFAGNDAQSMRRASSSSSFYFPGPDYKQGPYGFSVQDPILLPRRSWEPSRVPQKSDQHANDQRPRNTRDAANDGGRRQAFLAKPTVPDMVRTTHGHELKLERVFQTLDRNREESCLEQTRFEDGNFGGRWCHPVRAKPGAHLGKGPLQPYSWMESDLGDMDDAELMASRIVSGITRALQENHSTLTRLFKAVNRGTAGVLELDEFIMGLVRIRVLGETETFSTKVIAQAMSLIDPDYDGRINFPALNRAVKAARDVQRKMRQTTVDGVGPAASSIYGVDLPVEVVKVDKNSKSVYNFTRSRDLFIKQQASLLKLHGERVDAM